MMTANDDAKRPNVNENGAAITTASVLRSILDNFLFQP